MALPFINGFSRKKRDQIIAIDLGSRTTKAVHLQRRPNGSLALSRYALLDAPLYEKKMSPELLSEHLRSVAEALGNPTPYVTLSVGFDDATVRQIEMPHIPVGEMRMVLKNNPKAYLQQELPNHVYDCYIFPPRAAANGAPKPADSLKTANIPKLKVLVTAAKQQLVADFQMAAKTAGLIADCIVPGMVGPLNAFEMSLPQVFENELVAMVDIGFKCTSVCILDRGELVLTRVVNIGGDKLTAGLAETMSISYAEAEGIKVGMAPEVQSALEMHVLPLGRELRASLDFFEHQQDRAISQVYVSGATAGSEMILQMLHAELIAECQPWNPTSFLQQALPGTQAVELDMVSSQLAVAVGAALATN